MEKYFKKILQNLEKTIRELELETDYPIQKTEAVIKLIVQSQSDLKEYVPDGYFGGIVPSIWVKPCHF